MNNLISSVPGVNIPLKDSPYITYEMYASSSSNLYILANYLKKYYQNKEIVQQEYLYYWMQDKIKRCEMLINIISSIYVAICFGLFTFLEGTWPDDNLALMCYFVVSFILVSLMYIVYRLKSFYEFHFQILIHQNKELQ